MEQYITYQEFFSSDIKAETNDYHPVDELSDKLKSKLKGVDLLSRAQWLEATIFTSGYLLSSQGERMAMAHSVDGRYPFMDHRVIEFCMKLRPSYKLKGLQEKYLLKKMMRNRVPEKKLLPDKSNLTEHPLHLLSVQNTCQTTYRNFFLKKRYNLSAFSTMEG